MGTGHSHAVGPEPGLRVAGWPRAVVLAVVASSGLLSLLGLLLLWPDAHRVDLLRDRVPFVAKGVVVVHARLTGATPICTTAERVHGMPCGDASAILLDGGRAGRTVTISLTPDVLGTGIRSGDHVLLFDTSKAGQATGAGGSSDYSFYRADRAPPLIGLAVLFALAVVLVAWRRGVMALLSLGFAGAVVVVFLIPALLSGRPPVPAVLAASVLILIVMLYLTHGLSVRTSVALVGALVGVALSTVFASLGIAGARLGGLGDDSASVLTFNVAWISVQQLVVASVILAGLGTLNDVTVTQAAAVWELRAAAPSMSRWDLFRSAMRIGRDHVASTVYTLVFAYLGTALVLLVAVQLYGGGPVDFLTSEDVAEEIVRTLVGALALVLAMPATTLIAALLVPGAAVERSAQPEALPGWAAATLPARRTRPVADELRRLPTDPWNTD